jgi:hypothetical protein
MHLQSFTDATNGFISAHVADGTQGSMNRTNSARATNGTAGVGTGVGYGTRAGYGMNGAQGNGTGICITE